MAVRKAARGAAKPARAAKATRKVQATKAAKPARKATKAAKPAAAPKPSLTKAEREAQRRHVATETLTRLLAKYPDAHCALNARNAFELLCATILSAQCTDARVNMVTPALFRAFPDAHALAAASQAEVEELVRSTGFYRNKAKNLIAMAQALVAEHGGEVPRTMAELHVLPGVGRKTANVILGNAYGIHEGITVDTHVTRIANLLGLTKHQDAVKIEHDLIPLFPHEHWAMISHLLIFLGRDICIARRPQCGRCPLADLCPSARLDPAAA